MRTHLNADNAAELFELCWRRSFRQAEELLAARFPKPDVRDLVRRLPARPPATSNVESFNRPRLFRYRLEHALQPPPQRRIEPLSADRYGVHFAADTEIRELLERVRALASHRLPGGDLKTALQRGLEAYEREMAEGFVEGTNGQTRAPSSSAACWVSSPVRASRRTLRADARAKQFSRMHGNSSS